MTDISRHMRALNKANKAGDAGAAAVIRGRLVQAYQSDAATRYDPAAGQSGFANFSAGVGRGTVNIGRNIGNMAGFISDDRMTETRRMDQPLLNTGAGRAGNFVGEVVATVPLAMAPAAALARVGGGIGKLAAAPIGRGVIEGATQGIVTADPNERGIGALFGGIAGAVVPGAGAAYRAARSGVAPTAAARRLMREGVELTPGQMNPGGFVNQLEEVAQALPAVGTVVTGARNRGLHQFQKKIAQRAAPPGFTVRAAGDVTDMVDDLSKAYAGAYDKAKGFRISPVIMKTGADEPLSDVFRKSVNFRGTLAKADERKAAERFLKNELSALSGRTTSSDDLLKMRSNIRSAIRQEQSQGLRKILESAERGVTESLESQLPKNVILALKHTDRQYGVFKIFEDAVVRGRDQIGGFTPAQFSAAVKEATQDATYARGGGRMRDLAKDAVNVFQPRQPLTGRQLLTAAPVLGAIAANPVTLGIPAAAGAGLMYGTQTGRALAAGSTGAQRGARAVERNIRRQIAAPHRADIAAAVRTGSVNALLGL